MGNRLSGLWCKKTTTLHINSEPKQQQQSEIVSECGIGKNNKSNRKKSSGAGGGGGGVGGAGTFRFGSARRLSLTSCVSRDKKSANKATTNPEISTLEQQYQELLQASKPAAQPLDAQTQPQTAMKVNAQLPTVKVSSATIPTRIGNPA